MTTAQLLARYSGPAEVVGEWGRVRLVAFHGEPDRGWGYDVWLGENRAYATINTDTQARWLAANYEPAARPA